MRRTATIQQSISWFETSDRAADGSRICSTALDKVVELRPSLSREVLKRLFVEDRHISIRWTSRQRCFENVHASPKARAQEAASFNDIQGNRSRRDRMETVNKEERWTTCNTKTKRPRRSCHDMNVDYSPSPNSSGCSTDPISTSTTVSITMAMSISDFASEVEPAKS